MVAQGDTAGALAAYRASLGIAERLAGQNPSHAEWQRDLSVSHERSGDVLVAEGGSGGRAGRLPGGPRHRRAAFGAGPQQHQLAARPLGELRKYG